MKAPLVSVAIAAALLASPAAAQQFRKPVSCDTCINFWAYFDEDSSSGFRDWNCLNSTYDNHLGTDFSLRGGNTAIPDGNDVVAMADGMVVSTQDGFYDRCTQCGGPNCGLNFGNGFANQVIIIHGNYRTIYGHMRMGSIRVKPGDTVTCGQPIGQIGSSGCSTGAHVHVEPRLISGSSSKPVDPFTGPCSPTTASLWVSQGAHRSMPAATCAGAGGNAGTGAGGGAGSTGAGTGGGGAANSGGGSGQVGSGGKTSTGGRSGSGGGGSVGQGSGGRVVIGTGGATGGSPASNDGGARDVGEAGTGSGGQETNGSGGSSGIGTGGFDGSAEVDGGCACRTAGSGSTGLASDLSGALWIGLVVLLHRRRRPGGPDRGLFPTGGSRGPRYESTSHLRHCSLKHWRRSAGAAFPEAGGPNIARTKATFLPTAAGTATFEGNLETVASTGVLDGPALEIGRLNKGKPNVTPGTTGVVSGNASETI